MLPTLYKKKEVNPFGADHQDTSHQAGWTAKLVLGQNLDKSTQAKQPWTPQQESPQPQALVVGKPQHLSP